MTNNIAVKFDSVSFSYPDANVLENASFHIHRGEFTAMVGPNGSGKTTVLKLLFGLVKPSSGNIEIFGSASQKSKKTNLAYVSQHMPSDNLFPISVRDIVRMGQLHPSKRYAHNNTVIEEALNKTGIAEIAERPYRSLSGGQKRRVLVARALGANPDLLVLDEPTANMDSESEARLYDTLGKYKGETTILVVTHDTEFVSSLTDRVLCLGDGKKIVQHGVEASASLHHGGTGQEMRVLHNMNVSEDVCCK